jgi:2-keto-4-pentenoate hydratase/2-oxohepta-3-ene-1,7-dioic acid hydratase in catechol pathway
MRYCRFLTAVGIHYGRLESRDGVDTIVELLPPWPENDSPTKRATDRAGFHPLSLMQARLLPPVTPSKIICVGRNYKDHASEMGNEVPKEPIIFYKPPSSIIGPGEAIQLPPESLTKRVDYEGELALVIAKRCRRFTPGEGVSSYIRGYTCANDVTARDLQKSDGQWTRAKGFDTFCPVGPIVSDELLPDSENGVELTTRVNGQHKQNGNTREFIFSLERILQFISEGITLEAGDLILTGTPAGVSPLRKGDVVEVSISGIGTLKNPVE